MITDKKESQNKLVIAHKLKKIIYLAARKNSYKLKQFKLALKQKNIKITFKIKLKNNTANVLPDPH